MSIPKKAPPAAPVQEEPVKEEPPPAEAPTPTVPALDERSASLQTLLEKFQEKTEKEIARVLKVRLYKRSPNSQTAHY